MSSHKRKPSSSTLDNEPARSKPRTDNNGSSLPSHVYVVMLETKPAYGPEGSEVRGVFVAMEDANNCLKGIVEDEYNFGEACVRTQSDDGRLSWESMDVGEGDGAAVRVEKQVLYKEGSYAVRSWPEGMDWAQGCGDGEWDEEEGDEEEEDEGDEESEDDEEEGNNDDDQNGEEEDEEEDEDEE